MGLLEPAFVDLTQRALVLQPVRGSLHLKPDVLGSPPQRFHRLVLVLDGLPGSSDVSHFGLARELSVVKSGCLLR